MDEDEARREQARTRVLNSLVVGVLRALAEANQRPPAPAPVSAADVALGLGAMAMDRSRRVSEVVGLAVRPLAAVLAPPASVRAVPSRWLRGLAERGRAEREATALRLDSLARRTAPRVGDSALGYVDLTDLVKDHVDLDAVVAAVDLDAAVARVDLDAIMERVDVDAIASKIDLDAIMERVDVDAIAAKIDLDAIMERVDIDAIAAKLDLDAVVARMDLIALAESVAEGIDLPGIIQSSTGSMASEAVREVRWQGIGADERVAAMVDRMLGRQQRRPGAPSGEPEPPSTEEQPPPRAEGQQGQETQEGTPSQAESAARPGGDAPGQAPGPAGGVGTEH